MVVKDPSDQSFNSGQKKDSFVGCTGEVFRFRQPPAQCCDVSGEFCIQRAKPLNLDTALTSFQVKTGGTEPVEVS